MCRGLLSVVLVFDLRMGRNELWHTGLFMM
jgi:hypothetical protein